MKLEMPLAIGLTSFGVYEVFSNYRDTAPTLNELHMAEPGDIHYGQRLMDSDLLVGGVAGIAAVGAAFLSKSWLPLVVVAITFLGISLYYHAVYNRPKQPTDTGGINAD